MFSLIYQCSQKDSALTMRSASLVSLELSALLLVSLIVVRVVPVTAWLVALVALVSLLLQWWNQRGSVALA